MLISPRRTRNASQTCWRSAESPNAPVLTQTCTAVALIGRYAMITFASLVVRAVTTVSDDFLFAELILISFTSAIAPSTAWATCAGDCCAVASTSPRKSPCALLPTSCVPAQPAAEPITSAAATVQSRTRIVRIGYCSFRKPSSPPVRQRHHRRMHPAPGGPVPPPLPRPPHPQTPTARPLPPRASPPQPLPPPPRPPPRPRLPPPPPHPLQPPFSHARRKR